MLLTGFAFYAATFLVTIPLLMLFGARLRSRIPVHHTVIVDDGEIQFVDRIRKNRWISRRFPFADVRSVRLSVNRIEKVPLFNMIFASRGMIFAHPEDPYITITINDRANKVLFREFQLHPRLEDLPELVAAIVKHPDVALKVDENVVDVSTWLESFAIEYDNHNAPERWVCFRYWYVDHHGAWGSLHRELPSWWR